MATGIVSLALSLDGQRVLSRIWLVATAAAWVVLVLRVVALVVARAGTVRAVRSPASLTLVAASSVLAAGLDTIGSRTLPAVLLALATALWGVISGLMILRPLPATGTAFMVTVAPESLAGVAALLARGQHVTWLAYAALALCGLGIAAYVVAMRRFELAQLREGLGDHWVAGGALAITALTLAQIAATCSADPSLRSIAGTVGDLGLAAWIAAFVWLVLLLAGELRHRRLAYHLRRWSTLFPVGMYAASGLEVARVAGFGPAASFARVWIWFGVALWIALALGAVADSAVRS
jgi:tellurite resistance protein TehA-like permease